MTTERFVRTLQAEGIPCRYGPQPFLPSWTVFRKLNRNPDAFPHYRPGRLKKGAYSMKICPRARWTCTHIITLPLDQHTGESELRDLEKALDKICHGREISG